MHQRRLPLLVLALTSCLISGLSAQEKKGAATLAKFEFAGTTLGGAKVDQNSFADNVVIIDLWGTWCPPCRKAIPELVKLYEKYKQHGLEIVGLCYAGNGDSEDSEKVRKFAAENRITYTLIPGTPEMRKQIPGFSGYPTLLMFEKGMKHKETHVGFSEGMGEEMETWVRGALGLDAPAEGKDAKDGKDGDKPAPEAKEEVPAGKLFAPGNGDRGLELEVETVAGKKLQFADLKGAPALIAITTSWDQEAVRTARFLEAVRKDHPKIRVLAWHLEKSRDPAEKTAAARAFLQAQAVGYEAFATELALARDKVHRFASMPTFLLFDSEGVLVLREGGTSDAIEQRVRGEAAKLNGK
jgi:thiol-disulfide isomerase/thioredoxin